MPRIGVSYDEVAAIADGMMAEEVCPTIKAVRERLGSGSCNTIHRHLSAWREARPQLAAAMPELPVSIINAFSREIDRAKSEARAGLEGQLVVSQAEAAELAATGESLETGLDKLTDELGEMSADRDVLKGKLQEQAGEIDRLSRENERERYSSESARIEVAQVRNKLEMQTDRLIEQSATIEALTAAHAAESQARVISERAVAVIDAKLEAERDKTSGLLLEKEALIAQVAAERQSAIVQVDAERHSAETARIQAVKITNGFELQTIELSEMISTNKELLEMCESDRNVRFEAEKQLAVLLARLEEQGRAAIQPLQSSMPEITTVSETIVTPAGDVAAVPVN